MRGEDMTKIDTEKDGKNLASRVRGSHQGRPHQI